MSNKDYLREILAMLEGKPSIAEKVFHLTRILFLKKDRINHAPDKRKKHRDSGNCQRCKP